MCDKRCADKSGSTIMRRECVLLEVEVDGWVEEAVVDVGDQSVEELIATHRIAGSCPRALKLDRLCSARWC